MPMQSHRLISVLAAALMLALAAPAAAKIYKWTDEQGNVHYGDEPPKGAEAVDLPPTPVYESPKRPSGIRGGARGNEAQREAAYKRVVIASPGDESTIRGTEQTITVSVTAEPRLLSGHSVTIELDGKPVASGRQLQFNVGPIYRGAHTLVAVVRDANGTVVTRSPQVTFFKHQPSVN